MHSAVFFQDHLPCSCRNNRMALGPELWLSAVSAILDADAALSQQLSWIQVDMWIIFSLKKKH